MITIEEKRKERNTSRYLELNLRECKDCLSVLESCPAVNSSQFPNFTPVSG